LAHNVALPGEGKRNVGPNKTRTKEIIMKSIRSLTLLNLAVGSLLAICFNSGLASAQTTAGKFNLPFEAHWGLATLPAGDYSFKVEGVGRGAIVRVFHGVDTVVSLVNQSYDETPSHEISLTIVRNSTGNFVRDLSLPEIGQVLHYAPHKAGHGSAGPEQEIARIPVTRAGK
jgi:hypothetical protein